jgi:hypothetical protein
MGIIGGIQYLGNRLGGRKPSQEKGRPMLKNVAGEKKSSENELHFLADTRLGQKIDTNA